MSPSLEDCPNEVIESIVLLLGLSDIRSLRLSSRTLATKATQDHFKSYFRSKHIDITDSALRAFVDITRPGRPGCFVQHLVLVGVVNNTKLLESIVHEGEEQYEEEDDVEDEDAAENEDEVEEGDDDEEEEEDEPKTEKQIKAEQDLKILKQRLTDYEQLHESGTDISLLSEAFSNIVENSKTRKLLSLSLEVIVYREDSEQRLSPLAGGSWRFIWKSAGDTFHTVMRSLAASSLSIEKLNIFNDRQLQRCSLACNELGSIDFDHKGLAISLASLKSLSLSFSEKVIFNSKRDEGQSYDPAEDTAWDEVGEGRDGDDIKAEAADEGNFIGLAKFLQLCSQLEDLELHQYLLGQELLSRADTHHERLLQRTAEMTPNMNLNRMELRGLYVREEDLLAFIQLTAVRKLFMDNVVMSSGLFISVFDYCSSNAACMDELYCDELFERGLRVYFDGPGHYRFPPLTGLGGCDKLQRAGAELKQPIIYRSAQDVAIGSPETAKYKLNRYREYGPPQRGTA